MNKEKSKRSRFNEIGTLDYVNESSVVRAASLVKKGIVLSLAHTYEIDMPTVWFHGPFFYTNFRTPENTLGMFKKFKNRLGSLVCRYELSDHTGTHVDSLNHATEGLEMFGGRSYKLFSTDFGTTELGIDTMPPVFTRGVLLDFPSYFGIDILEESYEITLKDVRNLARKKAIGFRAGDAIIFYTGYSKLWRKDSSRYLSSTPGPGPQVAKWLLQNKFSITGSDTCNFEVASDENNKELFPCHQILIKRGGMHIIENLNLDQLASAGVTEFLFVCAPLKLKGGAGSPVAPIAVI